MNRVNQAAWIPMCCVCRQVRDDPPKTDLPTRAVSEQWMSLKSILRLYRIAENGYRLTHTYCPQCFDHFMEQLAFKRQRQDCDSPLSGEVLSAESNTILAHQE